MLIGYYPIDYIDFILNEKAAVFGPYDLYATSPRFMTCKIVASSGKYGFRPTAIGYQKHSPYAEIFDYYFERMRATGILDRIKAKYSLTPQECPDLR